LHHPSRRSGTRTNHAPFGSAKGLGSSRHVLDVRGWTIDPDTPKKATRVIAVVSGGTPARFTIRLRGLADETRAGLTQRYPSAGANHGFDLRTTLKRAQTVRVKVLALDTTDGSRTVVKTLSVAVP
jgi:hypothetical protein